MYVNIYKNRYRIDRKGQVYRIIVKPFPYQGHCYHRGTWFELKTYTSLEIKEKNDFVYEIKSKK